MSEPIDSNDFRDRHTAIEELMEFPPVDSTALITSIVKLEGLGTRMLGRDELDLTTFATTMHRMFTRLGEIEVEPPLDSEQLERAAGKVATYASLVEVAGPKPEPKEVQPTPTDAIVTTEKNNKG